MYLRCIVIDGVISWTLSKCIYGLLSDVQRISHYDVGVKVL